ncbi:hypothetical protein [Rhizobium sp. LC145]|jgi:hypothetical protein|uniref:hypothetical protein n=1 Tax=Rhizobium sp. LC145 TaxID=1120688 RepID=UPI00062A3EAA|nr:hypothetical protein [Rhizobium sp. LC145]KKX31689.1 hypothetical protein YH62_09465 [Rhizobium sp. LC145]TKT59881.1 hypothetical protein FDR95_08825 [Rhizobiaceae bacterium LC148]
MLKGAWLLPVVMLMAILLAALAPAASFAADDEFRRSRPMAFKDLPGVVPEEERVQQPSYTCTTDIVEVHRWRGRYDILYGDTAPRRVYRCKTEGGPTYTGTNVPNTQWVPGLNPHHLPR